MNKKAFLNAWNESPLFERYATLVIFINQTLFHTSLRARSLAWKPLGQLERRSYMAVFHCLGKPVVRSSNLRGPTFQTIINKTRFLDRMAVKKIAKKAEKKTDKKVDKKSEKKKSSKTVAKKAKSSIEISQPVVNIGLFGHVDHGKTTLTERLSGKWTDTHSEELKRGITIRLGYADAVFRRCPQCKTFTVKTECPKCKSHTEPTRKVSFIDAPGHESLMATMIGGAALIDGALLLISANEECPQPQTKEHLMTLQIIGVKNIVVIQNKIDLVTEEQALKNYNQIKEFLKGTAYEDAPVIPISAKLGINISFLIEAIEKSIKTPVRDSKKDPIMYIARSFDINKPGTDPRELKGGVLGGVVVQGKFKLGDEIEILPGISKDKVYKPIKTKIVQMITGGKDVKELVPGGSVAIRTELDSSIIKSDSLSGSVIGKLGKLPPVWNDIDLELHLLDRVLGTKEDLKVEPIKMNEILMLNVNSAATVGFVNDVKKSKVRCKLKIPICASKGDKVTISRRIGNRFRLIGYGILS